MELTQVVAGDGITWLQLDRELELVAGMQQTIRMHVRERQRDARAAVRGGSIERALEQPRGVVGIAFEQSV